jgi:class 3 adenylate cyclase
MRVLFPSEGSGAGHERRKRWLGVHAGLFALVNGFFVGTWLMERESTAERLPEVAPDFWPGWLMLMWGTFLGVHALYVWARRPTDHKVALRTIGARKGRVVTTVLFTDIVGSTERASALGDRRWSDLLDRHDRLARGLVKRYGGKVVKQTGDGLLAIFDVPKDAIACAAALRAELRKADVEIRAGLHAGEVEFRRDDVAGIGIHIASRVMAAAGASEVLVSRTVRDLVSGADISFADRGTHKLKGVQGSWQLYALTSA